MADGDAWGGKGLTISFWHLRGYLTAHLNALKRQAVPTREQRRTRRVGATGSTIARQQPGPASDCERPRRTELAGQIRWAPNVMAGTSVEDHRVAGRVDHLRGVPAYTRFLSCEPLIGPVGAIDLDGIGWVIVGGESGPKARPMDPAWARELRDQCQAARVPFFFKQGGRHDAAGAAVGKKRAGRNLDGRTWDEHPAVPGYPDPHAVGVAEPQLMSDAEWDRVAGVLPGRPGTQGGRGVDNRAFVEAVRRRAWSGRPWRDLPERYRNWNTAAVRAKRWREGGHWGRVSERLDDPVLSAFVRAGPPRRRQRPDERRPGRRRTEDEHGRMEPGWTNGPRDGG